MKKTSLLVLLAMAFSSQVQSAHKARELLLAALLAATPVNQEDDVAGQQPAIQNPQGTEERQRQLALQAKNAEQRNCSKVSRRGRGNTHGNHLKKPNPKYNKQVSKNTQANRKGR